MGYLRKKYQREKKKEKEEKEVSRRIYRIFSYLVWLLLPNFIFLFLFWILINFRKLIQSNQREIEPMIEEPKSKKKKKTPHIG